MKQVQRKPGNTAHTLVRSAFQLASLQPALGARALAAEILPGVDTGTVSVVPLELDRISPHTPGAIGLYRRSVHGQQRLWPGLRLPSRPAFLAALFKTGCTRAGIAQECEAPRARVAVGPIDLHTLALGQQHSHLRRSRYASIERLLFRVLACLLFGRHDTDSFMTHRNSLQGTGVRDHLSGGSKVRVQEHKREARLATGLIGLSRLRLSSVPKPVPKAATARRTLKPDP